MKLRTIEHRDGEHTFAVDATGWPWARTDTDPRWLRLIADGLVSLPPIKRELARLELIEELKA